MPNYHRAKVNGGTFFFTVVTYHRRPILSDIESINLLKQCIRSTIKTHPFHIDAMVVLPDHIHTIWTLPNNDSDYSTRWKLIKAKFSHQLNPDNLPLVSDSFIRKSEKGLWQRRFWEHAIRDEVDFERHCDYIHYNPVKYGYVNAPDKWTYSSFASFVYRGLYPANWGNEIDNQVMKMDFE